MESKKWVIEALEDLIKALPDERYLYARHQIADAIESIILADTPPPPPDVRH